ncbi:hypothetical protein PSEUDO9AG_50285 [Pseudomonas sp. 9Ag]|nr:hypothetical protein PSEUDO9AG_50285 [Pseudomonas sp. 9Ag]
MLLEGSEGVGLHDRSSRKRRAHSNREPLALLSRWQFKQALFLDSRWRDYKQSAGLDCFARCDKRTMARAKGQQ